MSENNTVDKKKRRKLKKRKILRKVFEKTQRNKQVSKKIKVLLKILKKTATSLINNQNKTSLDKVDEMLREVYKEIDKAVSKEVFHKNEAARKKSRITKYINKVLANQNLSKV
jgi:small subunit ribosomal protein S20